MYSKEGDRGPQTPFLLTTSWDDGHPLDLRIAELLTKYGLRGTFYVPLYNSRPTMSPAQIRELAGSFEIGAHTITHPILARLDPSAAREEIMGSKRVLEQTLGHPVRWFAYPNGRPEADYTREHVHMVREAGYEAAVSTAIGAASAASDLFELPRFTPWSHVPLRFDLSMARNLWRSRALQASAPGAAQP